MALQINTSLRATKVGGKRSLSSVKAIVFHYTGNSGSTATALGNARYFARGCDGRAASAHYCVDEKNIAYECVPLDTVAWSVGDGQSGKFGRFVNNSNSVSIEMVSHTDSAGNYYIPIETQKNAARLYQMLLKKLPNVQYVVRHYDISGKLCPQPMVNEVKWNEFKKLLEEVDEVVERSKIIVNGKECPVDRILKDGTNYVKIRDVASALNLNVSSKGNIAILETKA
jgi:N-acetylmuramoyl-L-alanine amidase CwlA